MLVRSRGGVVNYRDTLTNITSSAGYPSPSQNIDTANLTAGMTVDGLTARAVPALTAAIRVAAEQVANLDLCVWTGSDIDRKKVVNSWQAKLLAHPNEQQTQWEFYATIEESISLRGNSFVWKIKDPKTQRIIALYALHPDQVRAYYPRMPSGVTHGGNILFYVGVVPGYVDPLRQGFGFYQLDLDDLIILRGFGSGGQILAPSPLDVFQQLIGSGLGRLNYEASLYSRGASSKLAITFPGNLTQEQADRWRTLFAEAYTGPANSSKALVMGGGATVHPISLSPTDLDLIQSGAFGVDEIARAFNVPASLLGGGSLGRSSGTPLTPEHEQDRWLRYGLMPRLQRIESSFANDPDLFPPGTPYYPGFETQRFLRGDLQTENAIIATQLQTGQLSVNEARALQGRGPVPGGDLPQLTPVGGAPNPSASFSAVQTDNSKD
jgi:HK97 family phage portal protein